MIETVYSDIYHPFVLIIINTRLFESMINSRYQNENLWTRETWKWPTMVQNKEDCIQTLSVQNYNLSELHTNTKYFKHQVLNFLNDNIVILFKRYLYEQKTILKSVQLYPSFNNFLFAIKKRASCMFLTFQRQSSFYK